MELPDLKQLDKIIALCRKRGVRSIKIDNVELTLSDDLPVVKQKATKRAPVESLDDTEIGSDSISPDEMLFWSTGIANEAASTDETGAA